MNLQTRHFLATMCGVLGFSALLGVAIYLTIIGWHAWPWWARCILIAAWAVALLITAGVLSEDTRR